MVLSGIDQHRWVLGLERMDRALSVLGHPERSYPHVLVAGTNGKGSTCVYLERILLNSGMFTGTTLSPHVSRFAEGRDVLLQYHLHVVPPFGDGRDNASVRFCFYEGISSPFPVRFLKLLKTSLVHP